MQLGWAPLLKSKLVEPTHLIANCASGVSGAGREAEVGALLAEAGDNFKAYGVKGHRHGPEINQQLRTIAGDDSVNCLFVPHLLHIIRGIHSTLYGRLTAEGQAADLQALFESFYAGERFVDVLPAGSAPETRSVRASNTVRIAVHKPQPDTVMVLVVEDNLTKGASGQAVQYHEPHVRPGRTPGPTCPCCPDEWDAGAKTRVHGKVGGLHVIMKTLRHNAPIGPANPIGPQELTVDFGAQPHDRRS